MANELGLADRWQRCSLLPWVRLFGGLLLVLAGVWLVVAGPLFHRLWLDIIGVVLLALGGYLFSVGVKGCVTRDLESCKMGASLRRSGTAGPANNHRD
jgi:hypothetical protein